VVLYVVWEVLAPYFTKDVPNPFAPFLFISNPAPDSTPDKPLYAKSYLDLVFIAYHIVFFFFVRQSIMRIFSSIARYSGIKREAKIDRFGEQGYAMIYFAVFGIWGYVCHH
jgi:very-long-chain ceramide synthase